MNLRILFVAACAIAAGALAAAFVPQAVAQQTCSVICPDGRTSETFSCTSSYVPSCMRKSATTPGRAAPAAAPNVQQQIMLNAAGTMMQMIIQQQQEDEARERAEAAAKAVREADIKRRQDARMDEARQRIQGMIGTPDTLTLDGLGVGRPGLQLETVMQPDAGGDCVSKSGTAFFGTPSNPQGADLGCDAKKPKQAARPKPPAQKPQPASGADTPPPVNPQRDVKIITPPKSNDCGQIVGFANPSAATPVTLGCRSSAPVLAKLIPVFRQPSLGGPIAGSDRPVICEPLSRQLDDTQQVARRAVLASDVYERYNPKQKIKLPVMAGFERISDNAKEMQRLLPGLDAAAIKSLLEPAGSDYRAAIYRDLADPKKIILAFRGTTSAGDWAKANVPQGAGLGSEYYSKAIELGKRLKDSSAALGLDFEIVGHSTGGGMASAAGLVNQVKATSFNTAGVNVNSLPKGTDLSAAPQYVTDYVVDGEPLNMKQDNPALTRAQVGVIAAIGGPVMTPMAIAAGAKVSIEQGVGAKQTLQEIAALFSGTPPAAIGRRVTLKPDPDDLNALDPLRLHYITAVVDAVAAQSRELYGQYKFNGCGG